MKTQLYYFDIYPKIVLKGKKSTINVKALSKHIAFENDIKYDIHVLKGNDNYKYDGRDILKDITANKSIITFEYDFLKEQEYLIYIYKNNTDFICQLSIYCVEKDLYELRPYLGDLHVHSYFSDGKESPEFVMAEYRKNGFDFATITDHERYFPSLQAIKMYKNAPIDMLIVEGEEVHTPDNFVHIINFGGEYSVNELCRDKKDEYYKEVEDILKKYKLENNDRNFGYGACIWAFDKIKKANGLSIFCHPHWKLNSYQIPDDMIYKLFKNRKFDAFELIGGQSIQENNMQVAYYNTYLTKNSDDIIPVVGNSDSHGTINQEWFKLAKTIVFARENSKNEIIKSIKEGYSVAMQRIVDEEYECYGQYRMVSYARFLLNEYFPIHKEVCFEEGRAMHSYINDEAGALENIKALKGRTKQLLDKYFL